MYKNARRDVGTRLSRLKSFSDNFGYMIGNFVGHAAMETSVCNMLEPGETVLVGVNGLWGERFSDMADRHGNLNTFNHMKVSYKLTCFFIIIIRPSKTGRIMSCPPPARPSVRPLTFRVRSITLLPFKNIFMKLGTNINHHQTMCREQEPTFHLHFYGIIDL